MAIQVILDHEQTRLGDDRLYVNATGEEFDAGSFSNAVSDPVNSFVILKPYSMMEGYYTSSSGNYAKLALSAFSGSASSWVESELVNVAAGKFISLNSAITGTAGYELYTTSTYSKNRGINLLAYNYGSQKSANSPNPLISVGWGTSASSSDLYFDLYPDGTIDIWKDGELVESSSISGEGRKTGKNTNTLFQLFVLPYNQNQILFWSGNGGSFVYTRDDILSTDTDPTIAPSGSIFVKGYADQGCKFMLSPALFPTSGYGISEKMNFIEAPITGDTLESWANDSWIGTEDYKIYGYPAYVGTQNIVASLVNWSGSAFTPNGVNTEVKLKFDLTTNNSGYTPTLVGGAMSYSGVTAGTFDEPVDISQFIRNDMTLDIPEDPTGVTLNFTCISDVTSAIDIYQLNRPIQILDNGEEIFNGIVTDVQEVLDGGYTEYRITARDGFELLDKYLFRERLSLAGWPITDAIEMLSDKGLVPTTAPIVSNSSFIFPFVSAKRMEDWGYTVSIGDTATSALQDTFESYAGTWVYGYGPTGSGVTFLARDPSDLPSSPSITLYESRAQALSVGGTGVVDDVYYDLTRSLLQPEANEIRVTGYDPRTEKIFQSYKADVASYTANTPPSGRPDNWIGIKRVYGLLDPAITTQEACDYACELLYDRLTPTRHLAEINCKVLRVGGFMLWRGDLITLYGHGDYRIKALTLTVTKEDWVGATYTLEKVV